MYKFIGMKKMLIIFLIVFLNDSRTKECNPCIAGISQTRHMHKDPHQDRLGTSIKDHTNICPTRVIHARIELAKHIFKIEYAHHYHHRQKM